MIEVRFCTFDSKAAVASKKLQWQVISAADADCSWCLNGDLSPLNIIREL